MTCNEGVSRFLATRTEDTNSRKEGRQRKERENERTNENERSEATATCQQVDNKAKTTKTDLTTIVNARSSYYHDK
jgi:hypothetical protein